MLQSVLFFLLLALPFFVYLLNMYLASRESRGPGGGIAGGIPKAKPAKKPRAERRARVRPARVTNCGRTFSHFALALVGSSSACRYCTYLETPPTPIRPDEGGDALDDPEAIIRAAEEIIDQSRQ
ncbi:hypothetical protein [Tepidiforma sp.]|uniref:hypothetical protein n=1 Tax=Tepidiforma sp. TaxID=2682230 RepID=UPI002ADE7FB6|nr:hypothetical protein [Tepidiforma sp.]